MSTAQLSRLGNRARIECAARMQDLRESPRTVYQDLRMRSMACYPPDLTTPISTLRSAVEFQCSRAREMTMQYLHGSYPQMTVYDGSVG